MIYPHTPGECYPSRVNTFNTDFSSFAINPFEILPNLTKIKFFDLQVTKKEMISTKFKPCYESDSLRSDGNIKQCLMSYYERETGCRLPWNTNGVGI